MLIILPSLYTWFNVVGFWNPYNNTGALKVCVVNEDEGAHNDLLGDLQLGDQIMDQLHENTQLNWEFTDYDDAMAKISSGEAYAAFVIPGDFSEDMTTLLTGEFQRPQLEYYVNEKLNPVAPKITDTGRFRPSTTQSMIRSFPLYRRLSPKRSTTKSPNRRSRSTRRRRKSRPKSTKLTQTYPMRVRA